MDKTFPSNLGDIIANVTGTVGATTPSTGTFTELTASALELNELSFLYDIDTYTPIVTLVGGTGNTVPQYTTNSGHYTVIGNRCFVSINLNGDGGDEGAGTGAIVISLPIPASLSSVSTWYPNGNWRNGAYYPIYGYLPGAASTITLYKMDITTGALTALTGADQNSTQRTLRLNFNYEV